MLKKVNFIFNPRQKRNILILFFLLFIGAFIEIIGVSVIAPLISLLSDESVFYRNPLFIRISQLCHIKTLQDMAFFLTVLIASIYALKNIYLCMQYSLLYRFTYNNIQRLSTRMMNCYLRQDYLFYVTNNVAELQRNITQDVEQFFSCVLAFIRLSTESLICIALIIYLLITEFVVTIYAIFILTVFMSAFFYLYRKKTFNLGVKNRIKSAERNKWVLQSFGGIKDIKTLGRENYFINKFDKVNKSYNDSARKYSLLGAIQKPVIEAGCICGVLFVVAIRIYHGTPLQSLVTSLGIFAVAAFRMLPSLNRISENYNSVMFYKSSVDAVYEDLKEIELLENNEICCRQDNILADIKADIIGQDISFTYPSGENVIFSNISFDIPYNKSVAIIGESGVGKSTLADMLLGHLHPDHGDITIDGISIFDHLYEWHQCIGYIPQTIYLMDDSIRNNVAFGIDEAEIDDKRVLEVLEEAQLLDFVSSLSEGLDTFVGDRGVRLSGGQRQRIGIARALYSNPKFIVFDEATSALDTDTETAVMEAINKMHGSRTIIIIAHRLTTIRNCDMIYKIDGGNMQLISKEDL